MSEVPTAVSESTGIEVVRKEGTARSFKAVNTITAGEILWHANSSGSTQAVTFSGVTSTIDGVALYSAVSGGRVVTIRGKVRVRWDGATNVAGGAPIAPSTTRSGWFEASSGLTVPIGRYIGTAPNAEGGTTVAGNSGTLLIVEIT